ncbi:MFS general substrate transporter [Amniculicola lignicola CBS 123094]|uniref:MFS general substrate transporter n=1 Tax=Amniculicola lignicola CBS 123094 TaxID=1392246 RepID=A0A6A5WK17_9PLEO|nr:MFS general substrate transporter [Amniculicola lignicola CBS 123094]
MLGFHRRTRSLIPVGDLAKYDQVPLEEEESWEEKRSFDSEGETEVDVEFEDEEGRAESGKQRRRQLMLVYGIFLAEAIMASSLQPQLQMLISNDDYCGNLSTSYLRSILDCAYAFGGTTGILWGYLSDRFGRRPITLLGLWGMFVCCLSMGFATDLTTCTIFRFVAGLASSSILVTALTMIGDLSKDMKERARFVARLPLLALVGGVGELVKGMVEQNLGERGVWGRWPVLGSQITCGMLVGVVAVVATFMLKETLPMESSDKAAALDMDCEKAGFLAGMDEEDLKIRVVDHVRLEPISINQFVQAPSLLVLLSSFCLLSLHASTFDVLLPHLGHSSTEHGGMGIPCNWLGVTVLIVRAVAGLVILHFVPKAIDKFGLLKLYRSVSLFFPAVYVVTPLLATLVCSRAVVAVSSTAAILVKHTLTNTSSVLVALLVLNTTPDAYSAGTVVGMMQAASLFKALAVAVSGASFYLSNDFSVSTTNYALWTCLTLFGGVGAALAWFVRDRPSVERDFPAEVLRWETCFDAEKREESEEMV